MKKYLMLGGGSITAKDNQEVVNKLRELSIFPAKSEQDFIARTAYTCKLYSSARIRKNSIDNFVKDLVGYGFLKEEGC